MSYWSGFPSRLSAPATANCVAPMTSPCFAVPCDNAPTRYQIHRAMQEVLDCNWPQIQPSYHAMQERMNRNWIQGYRVVMLEFEQAQPIILRRGRGINGASKKREDSGWDGKPVEPSGIAAAARYLRVDTEGRFRHHRDPIHVEWRNKVMEVWVRTKSEHRQCTHANSFYKPSRTLPCDMGWGKILFEHMEFHGKESTMTKKPDVILEEYRRRHMHMERRKTPEMRLVPGHNSDHRVWELIPEEQEKRRLERTREQASASSSSTWRHA